MKNMGVFDSGSPWFPSPRKPLSRLAKRVIAGAIVLSSLFGGYEAIRYFTSEKYKEGKELDRIAAEVLPNANYTPQSCTIDGKDITIEVIGRYPYTRASIIVGDSLRMYSEDWEGSDRYLCDGPAGDARNLESLEIKTEHGWEYFNRGEIPQSEAWQRHYESVLRAISREKAKEESREKIIGRELEIYSEK